MTRPIQTGVMAAVKVSDVDLLTDAEQDDYIKTVARHLEGELRTHVGDTPPLSDLAFWVTGPHNDPIQGLIHVHHLAGTFDQDRLPTDCPAYLGLVNGQAPAASALPTITTPG